MVVFGKNIRLATDTILSAIVRISYLWTEFPPFGLNVLKISLKIHVKKNCLARSQLRIDVKSTPFRSL